MAETALTVAIEGLEAVQKVLARQRRDFYRAQRVQMGKALNVMRAGVRAAARAQFTRRTGRMQRSIGRRIFDGGGPNITGQIAFFRRGYYAVHEQGGLVGRGVRLQARPFFGPAAEARREQALAIIGDSFQVFEGGSVA